MPEYGIDPGYVYGSEPCGGKRRYGSEKIVNSTDIGLACPWKHQQQESYGGVDKVSYEYIAFGHVGSVTEHQKFCEV